MPIEADVIIQTLDELNIYGETAPAILRLAAAQARELADRASDEGEPLVADVCANRANSFDADAQLRDEAFESGRRLLRLVPDGSSFGDMFPTLSGFIHSPR